MLDFRLKKPSSALNWRYQEILVTQEYLDARTADPNLIKLDYDYVMGNKVLDVYFNGLRAREGGEYEEIDPLHIRLGPSIELQVGDEIVIKEWFNADSVLYGSTGINTRLTNLEIEIHEARLGFPKLKDKLIDMDRELANLLGEGDYDIDYEYGQDEGADVLRENVTGEHTLTRDFTYNEHGKPTEEVITRGDKVTTRTYIYDGDTGRIVKVTSRTI